MEMLHEVFSILGGQKGIMEMHLGNPRKGSQDNVFDTGLRGCRHRDGVPVATQACGYP